MNAGYSKVFQFRSPIASFVYFRIGGRGRMPALIKTEQTSFLAFQAGLLLDWIDPVNI